MWREGIVFWSKRWTGQNHLRHANLTPLVLAGLSLIASLVGKCREESRKLFESLGSVGSSVCAWFSSPLFETSLKTSKGPEAPRMKAAMKRQTTWLADRKRNPSRTWSCLGLLLCPFSIVSETSGDKSALSSELIMMAIVSIDQCFQFRRCCDFVSAKSGCCSYSFNPCCISCSVAWMTKTFVPIRVHYFTVQVVVE